MVECSDIDCRDKLFKRIGDVKDALTKELRLKMSSKNVGIFITTVSVVLLGVFGYLSDTQSTAQDKAETRIERVEEKGEKRDKKVQSLEVAVGKMQSDMEHVLKAIDKQDEKLDKILEAVKP